jgi:dolichol-phosphate mannosyltransferase
MGGIVVAVNLSVLYALTEYAHIYYLVSAICSFVIAFCVSFVLQKYITFKDGNHERLHRQIIAYLFIQLTNLLLNTTFLYVFVTYLHIWYILSQIIISFVLAVIVFFINKKIIFIKKEHII